MITNTYDQVNRLTSERIVSPVEAGTYKTYQYDAAYNRTAMNLYGGGDPGYYSYEIGNGATERGRTRSSG